MRLRAADMKTIVEAARGRARELRRSRVTKSSEDHIAHVILTAVANDLKLPNIVKASTDQVAEILRRVYAYDRRSDDIPF